MRIKNLAAGVIAVTSITACSTEPAEQTFGSENIRITYRTGEGTAGLSYKGIPVFENIRAAYVLGKDTITTKNYRKHTVSQREISDSLGNGTVYEIRHDKHRKGLPILVQRFCFYSGSDSFFTETELETDEETGSNYMAPFIAGVTPEAPFNGDGKMLFVPFDNDCWIQYDVVTAGDGLSYETTAIFRPESREGLVIGSVEHGLWKTGIRTGGENGTLRSLESFGGVTSTLTRDTLPHGLVKGPRIKSPKIMIGFSDDWRDGMERYAEANSRIAPAPEWNRGTPFGWNSWGSIQTKINLGNACEVSDFFKNRLQPKHFENEGTVYIGLDSYWDNFSDAELKAFVEHCKRNGQTAGIYWAPFVDWAKNPKRRVEGSDSTRYKDIYLYAYGKPQELDGAWAVDPTHPAVKKRIDYYTDRFKAAGFEYIKIDFLTHGAMEADKHHDPKVTTGIRAYNEGMDYLNKALEGKFYITQAISPLFPSNYAHSRRIACDAFASLKDTEYTLNGLSYGWWLDKAYRFNDPDHLVLMQKNETEGENRARLTSGVITGIYMLGDDLSGKGDPAGKQRVEKFATNAAVADIARIGRSFRPIYGYMPSEKKRAESLFMLEHDGTIYLAAFNFGERPEKYAIPLKKLGLDESRSYRYAELWSGTGGEATGSLTVTVPGKDVFLLRIDK